MKRINFIMHYQGLGGLPVHSIELLNRIAQLGHQVNILIVGKKFIPEKMHPILNPGHNIYQIEAAHISLWSTTRKIISWVKANKADACIFVQGVITDGRIYLFWRLLNFHKQFFVILHSECWAEIKVSTHWSNPVFKILLFMKTLRATLLPRIKMKFPTTLICVSRSMRDHVTSRFRIYREKVVVFDNGVDVGRFKRSMVHRALHRQSWKVKESSFVFGTVGRLSVEKGHRFAIEALAKLIHGYLISDLFLVICGEGDSLHSLQKLAGDLNVVDQVRFIGSVPDPSSIYSGFNSFVFPSLSEGTPLALLEAMSCECPIVASGVGGILSIVTSESIGLLCPAGDVDALTRSHLLKIKLLES